MESPVFFRPGFFNATPRLHSMSSSNVRGCSHMGRCLSLVQKYAPHVMLITAVSACSHPAETLAAPYNPVLVAVTSAAGTNFDSLKTGEGEPTVTGFVRYHVRGVGEMVPKFGNCIFTFGPRDRSLHCRRNGGKSAEPEFSRLAAFIDASVPASYVKRGCSDGPKMPYCMEWRTAQPGEPIVDLISLGGNGGAYVYFFEVHKPMGSR